MKRNLANMLIAAALLAGVGLATAGILQTQTSNLPAVPSTYANTIGDTVATGNDAGVEDLADWQRTRIKVGKASNPQPKAKTK